MYKDLDGLLDEALQDQKFDIVYDVPGFHRLQKRETARRAYFDRDFDRDDQDSEGVCA